MDYSGFQLQFKEKLKLKFIYTKYLTTQILALRKTCLL